MQHEAAQTLKRIYLDYNATTPVDPRVLEAMQPYFSQHFGNASSGLHAWGWTANSAVEKARGQIAGLLNCKSTEVFFNSGATEGNNSVLFGLFHLLHVQEPSRKIHYLVGATEHASVHNAALALRSLGVDVEFLPTDKFGRVSVEQVNQAIRHDTKLISVMWANNELGSVNPIAEIAQVAHSRAVLFHTDAVQAIGKTSVDLKQLPIDLLTFSGHKIYGPKGTGVLFKRANLEIDPLIFGGGQEHNLRSGTLNVPGIVGLGVAAEIAQQNLQTDSEQRKKLWAQLREGIQSIPEVQINTPDQNFHSTLSLTFPGRPIAVALPKLQRLGISTGSACGIGKAWVSHTLRAIGFSEEEADCTLRLSLGRNTTEAEIQDAATILKAAFS